MSRARPSIDERFEDFCQRNPEILQRLIELAREAKRRGYKTYSLKALWEVLRFQADPNFAGRYKLSNNYTSRYARLVMETAPDLRGFFETRDLKDERGIDPEVRAQAEYEARANDPDPDFDAFLQELGVVG
jgi:hypothetical protein